MENAKITNSSENNNSKYENENFENLINELLKIANYEYEPLKSKYNISLPKRVKRGTLLKQIFGSKYPDKINIKSRALKPTHIVNCMKNALDSDGYFFSLSDAIDGALRIGDKNDEKNFADTPDKNDDTQNNDTKKDKGKNFIDTIDESETKLKYYMDAMDSLYEQYTPYPRFNMDNQETSFLDEEYDEEHALSIFWNKLILLISAIGLRSNKVNITSETCIEIPTKHFTEAIKNLSQLIFYGPPECGKTTFLKHYTKNTLKQHFT
ncbi:MAG: hypothetical protein LUG54_03790 [Clostridiales bacterium]|nr:hypothetical protein [Clostridiales bacterium]